MPRKPSSEPCQEKGGQYIHKPKRNGVAVRISSDAWRLPKDRTPHPAQTAVREPNGVSAEQAMHLCVINGGSAGACGFAVTHLGCGASISNVGGALRWA